MEYISAEEFLKQPNEVQNLLLDWWKCDNGDLYINKMEYEHHKSFLEIRCCFYEACKDNKIPLFTEGQLRKFIEDKTGYKVDIEYHNAYKTKADILFRFCIDRKEIKSCMFCDSKTLIQAYWKVALEIAKEKVQHEV